MSHAISILPRFDIQSMPQKITVVEYVLKGKTHLSTGDVINQAGKNCVAV